MESILVLGKVLWDVILQTEVELTKDLFCFPFKEKTLVKTLLQEPGGGAVNVSLGLKKLGFQPLPVALVGKDFLGEEIRERLKQEEIITASVGSVSHNTGTSVIILGREGLHTALIYPGANRFLKAEDFDFSLAKQARWWYILSWGNTDPGVIETLIKKKTKWGKHLAFNPGKIQLANLPVIRPLLSHTDILIVNEQEVYTLLGARKPLEKAMRQVVGLGPKIVVVTLGKRGSAAYDGGYFYRAPVYPAKVVDSLGCGDAYSSAFLAWFIKTGKIEKAIMAGTINSASVVSHRGTTKGQLSEKEIEAKIKENKLKVRKKPVGE